MRILVVEDELELLAAIARGLRREGYGVDESRSLGDAQEQLSIAPYDLVLLDLGLPDGDGLALCRAIRAGGDAATQPRILILTARDALDDRVLGLDTGADDYLVKPFAFPELLARVRALLRREGIAPGVMRVGAIELDAGRRRVDIGGREVPLTAKEFALLRYLMLHAGQVLSAEELLEHVWDANADPFTNTVKMTMSNLRRKLAEAGSRPIETLVGQGYRLREA